MIDLESTFKLAMSHVKLSADVEVPEKIHDDFNKRIEELGLSKLTDLDSDQKFNIIEDRLWSLADKVGKPIIFYDVGDYENAINFLEIFSLYACCLSNQKSIVKVGSGNWGLQYISRKDLPVLKLLRELEDLNKIIHGSSKDKVTLKATIKTIKKHIDKVFLKDLGKTEQRALGKIVNEAKEILSHLA